eukprot:624635-Prorocentrum_minimum.AAC.1
MVNSKMVSKIAKCHVGHRSDRSQLRFRSTGQEWRGVYNWDRKEHKQYSNSSHTRDNSYTQARISLS